MTETIIYLDPEPIFDILGRDGERWIKGWGNWNAPAGEEVTTCMYGAVRRCATIKGNAYIIEQVDARFGFGTAFNDKDGWEPVRDRILQGFDITDEMLLTTFGPQWREIVALVRRAATLTDDEAQSLAAGWAASRDAGWAASWAASWAAIWDAIWDAIWGAAVALCARDLIGQHGFTQAHYDTLTRPWREVIGPVHPDDAPLGVQP